MGSNPIARSWPVCVLAFFLDWRRSQVVRQRSAKPSSPVRIRSSPLYAERACGNAGPVGAFIVLGIQLQNAIRKAPQRSDLRKKLRCL